jgi:hypothetical protein
VGSAEAVSGWAPVVTESVSAEPASVNYNGMSSWDVVLRGRGAVLGGEGELRAPEAHIQIRIAPAV